MTGWIGRLGVIAGIVVAVAACGSTDGPTQPNPMVVASPVVAPKMGVPKAQDDAAIAYAIAQRRQFGLRSDEAWVRSVAADPRARIQLLDFLMLPEEEVQLQARESSLETVVAAVNDYAAEHRDQFGGVWIDQAGHTVVAAWTESPAIHQLAILARLGTTGPLATRLVRYSEHQLAELQDRLFADPAWYASIAASPLAGGTMVMDNRVELSISSANPDAPALIRAHFGVGADMLKVLSDGTGIVLQPRGTVLGAVVTADGKAPGQNGLMLAWTADRPGGGGGDCGEMAGVGVPPDGTFRLPCAPGGWTIAVQASAGDTWVDVGKGHVVVPAGGTVELTITLDKGTRLDP
jgi:hypothetical protein